MSDQPGPLPELSPEQEDQVRRLLAEARHDEPVPADVGERLDRVLAGLSRETNAREAQAPEADPVAPVVDLAARRRRRNAAALLAGAAAVIVAGFAFSQAADLGGSADDSATGGSAAGPSRDQSLDGADSGGGEAAPEDAPVHGAQERTFSLSSANLKHDVQAQLRSARTPAPSTMESYGAVVCPATPSDAYGAGEIYPAQFDSVRAVLALRPPDGGLRLAEVLECGSGAPLASVEIPVR